MIWHHHMRWHDMFSRNQSHYLTPRHLTTNHITSSHLATNLMTSKQATSPPWNGWRLVHTKNSVWASHWLVALRTFYRQSLFWFILVSPLETSAPGLPGSTRVLKKRTRKVMRHERRCRWHPISKRLTLQKAWSGGGGGWVIQPSSF